MHEFSLVAALLDIIREEMTKHGATRLLVARVRYGALNNVVPDSMHFAFEAQTRGTSLEGAALELEEIPLQLLCHACGEKIVLEKVLPLDSCPACKALISPDVESGQEIRLSHLEME